MKHHDNLNCFMGRVFASTFIACFWVIFFFPSSSEADDIRIGFVAPLTGPNAKFGKEEAQTMMDAVSAFNKSTGREIELIKKDDACDPDQSMLAAKRLVDLKVNAVIGHCSRVAPLVADFYERSKTIFISTSTLPSLFDAKRYRYVFHLGATVQDFVGMASRLITQRFNGKSVGIIGDDGSFGTRIASQWTRGFRAEGTQVVFNRPITDSARLKSVLRATKPKVVLFAVSDPSLIMKFYQNGRPSTSIVTLGLSETPEDSWVRFWNWVKNRKVDAYVFAPSSVTGSPYNGIQEVLDKKAKSERPPTIEQIYDIASFELVLQAIAGAGSTAPDLVERSLRRSTGFTALGALHEENGEIVRIPYYLYDATSNWTPSKAFLIESPILRAPTMPSPHVGIERFMTKDSDLLSRMADDIDSNRHPPSKNEVTKAIISADGKSNLKDENIVVPVAKPELSQIAGKDTSQSLEEQKSDTPFYNIEIVPKRNSDPIVLAPSQPTSVSFHIGSLSTDSVTPGIKPSPPLEAIANGRPLELTVTLFTDVSETDTYQLKRTVYDPVKKCSERITFEIIPTEKS